ncbi:helix-hairpin-helix domain-containing protein [Sulfurimonas sp. SAG-AH-194-I05]|nr:helix-hairpin-helix domain-containing protein [Sulfurimonas sp. SAG-AH-194-I05]MDF1875735.1 helix-hairpin-helix domain-containing protein [Sulfurimonas sp. SAG-AH-194-I05]
MKYLFMMLLAVNMLFGSVDINNANEKELVSLHGVGVKKAMAIIEFRKSHCFKTIKELSKVKGIGKKTVFKNADKITVGPCKSK